MADVEFEHSRSLSRADAAKLLARLAEALGGGEENAHLPVGDSTLKVRVPEQVRVEVEVEVDGDELELEVELTWSLGTRPAADVGRPEPGVPAAHSSGPGDSPPGDGPAAHSSGPGDSPPGDGGHVGRGSVRPRLTHRQGGRDGK